MIKQLQCAKLKYEKYSDTIIQFNSSKHFEKAVVYLVFEYVKDNLLEVDILLYVLINSYIFVFISV